jgi:hypothetical protein
MNVYFLVEGRSTEKKLYKFWLSYLVPKLKQVNFYDEISNNNYYLMSGNGYPSIIKEILNCVNKMQEVSKYNYFVICLDADEDTIESRKNEITDFIKEKNIELGNIKLIPIIQNRCIETWLLGNRRIFNSRQPQQPPLSDYTQHYDVYAEDPELIKKYKQYNHSQFHFEYLKAIFQSKNIAYTKKNPGEAQKEYYLQELKNRIRDEPQHLKSFQEFIEFCNQIAEQIDKQSC